MGSYINPELVMLDLETLGTRPGDAILSIGAVKFSPSQGISATFYRTISGESCKEIGLRATKATLEWWAKQDEKVRKEAFKGEWHIKKVLEDFTIWLHPDSILYGNGANFDNALLGAAYRAAGLDVPWKFWNDRCFRTLKNMFMKHRVERTGAEHHALEDAKYQALQLIQMVKDNGLELK